MIKPWNSPAHSVYRVYLQGWTKTGGWSAAVDVIAFDEIEAKDLILNANTYDNCLALPEAEFSSVEAFRIAWWIKVWLKKKGHDMRWRFELRDIKEW